MKIKEGNKDYLEKILIPNVLFKGLANLERLESTGSFLWILCLGSKKLILYILKNTSSLLARQLLKKFTSLNKILGNKKS